MFAKIEIEIGYSLQMIDRKLFNVYYTKHKCTNILSLRLQPDGSLTRTVMYQLLNQRDSDGRNHDVNINYEYYLRTYHVSESGTIVTAICNEITCIQRINILEIIYN